MNHNDDNKVNNSEDISLTDILLKFKAGLKYIKSKWLLILLVGLIGGTCGFLYAFLKKPTYTAVCTFVLEDTKSSSMGQYGALASLAGINMGGGGGGIFEGDNIIELYKSRSMIEKALLSPCNFNGRKQFLIDRFIASYDLRSKKPDDGKISNIDFNGDPDKFSRVQDSIITVLADFINQKILNVSKPDKKLNIIDVEVTSTDELFSKLFTEKLVQNVNEFYIETKSKKSLTNVQILQHQADSVKTLLNSSIYGVASAIDAAPNANPDLSSLRVPSQKKQIEVQANSAIYSEMVKNLELAKITLRQEMPLIQVIDKPVLPLVYHRTGKIKTSILSALVLMFIAICFLCVKKIVKLLL